MSTSSYRNRTTPGVYITEIDAFPRSVPGVQTAIPAFIGYTERANIGGKSAYLTPIRLNSLADYEAYFGRGFEPLYVISEADNTDYDFVAQYWEPPKDPADPQSFGKFELKHYKLSRTDKGKLSQTHASSLPEIAGPAAELGSFNLYNSVRLFYANGGGTCYVVSVGDYTKSGTVTYGVPISKDDLSAGLKVIADQVGPTMLVIPDAVRLPPKDSTFPPTNPDFGPLCGEMLKQCATLQDRVAILDVYGANAIGPQVTSTDPVTKKKVPSPIASQIIAVTDQFHTSVGDSFLNYGMAYFPFLVTSIIQPSEIDYTNFAMPPPPPPPPASRPPPPTGQIYLDDFLKAQACYSHQPQGAKRAVGPADDDDESFIKIKGWIDEATNPTKPPEPADIISRNQNLVAAIPVLQQMETLIARRVSLLPPSAAMAGIYTTNDVTRGVWSAPANLVLNAVIEPNVKLDDHQQGLLNVPLDGKAINVIRQFAGRGPVVWGARTLDGNSNDWRYIQVRRTIVYVEQSIKTALQQFVFAANTGSTWVSVTAMVSNFLSNLWSQGGLMGTKPDEAFSVQCGLGSTMTGMDVLLGYMIVQVRLQMIRPAEFIELTFKQQMQGTA